MPKIDLELMKGSFTFFDPDKLLAVMKNVEERETLISRPRYIPVQRSNAPRELLDFFPSPMGPHVEDSLDLLRLFLVN